MFCNQHGNKMKRILFSAIIATGSFAAHAQNKDQFSDGELKFESLHLSMTLLMIVLFSIVILTFVRWILDYRLKNKLIEKGAPDHVVSQLLQPVTNDNKNITIKWFAMLMGLGIGLSLVNYFQPLGIHSLAMMSFSLATSFLGYYFFIKRAEKS
jgi:hypothetical protein